MAEDKKADQAAKIVRNHTLVAAGIGVLPFPLVDIALYTGVQLRMLHRLADLYGVEFSKQRANWIIASLVGVSATTATATLLKGIPVYGAALGTIGVVTSAGATTYAIGKVFIKHFESGGTFMAFDPEKAREYYAAQVDEAEEDLKSYAGIKP